jgi:hypothetical protein
MASMIGLVAFMLADPAPALEVTYPEAIYPKSAEVRKSSEMPFVETGETLGYGFDTPFPRNSRKTFLVENYGGAADGIANNTGAFYDALQAALASRQPAEVVFGKTGRYYFRPIASKGSDASSILNVLNASNLLIRGQGAGTKLIFGDPALGGLCVSDSTNVMIRDFSVDYDPLGFTQGSIESINASAGSFVLRLSPAYPTPASIREVPPHWHGGNVIHRAGAYRWPAIGGLEIADMSLLRGNDWTLQTRGASLGGYMNVESSFVYIGRRTAHHALLVANTTGFYLKNVSVYASPTCGLGLVNLDGVNIDGYADMIATDSDRLLASNADGIFSHGVRGGITIKNSYFMGQGDDCINLHSPAFPSRSVTCESDTQIFLKARLNLRAGDLLEVMNPARNTLKGKIAITSVIQSGAATRCTLAAGLSTAGYDPGTDYIYPVSLSSSNFKIVHNYFGQNRSRCLLIQARHGLIQANTCENAEGYGVILSYGGTEWVEGIVPSDITIRSNVFRNVTGAGLAATIVCWGGSGAPVRNLKRVTIEGNTFINPRKMAVTMTGCEGVVIANNCVSTAAGKRHTRNDPKWFPVDCSIYMQDSAGVSISGYKLTDPNITQCALYIGNKCAAGTAGITTNGITAVIPGTVPVLLDQRP